MANQKTKTSKQSVATNAKRRAYYTNQYAITEKNLKRKGKTNKKNKLNSIKTLIAFPS